LALTEDEVRREREKKGEGRREKGERWGGWF
jgi:hypothetical protein